MFMHITLNESAVWVLATEGPTAPQFERTVEKGCMDLNFGDKDLISSGRFIGGIVGDVFDGEV
jgi:hypothetical protein